MVVESGLKRSDMSNGNVFIFDFSGTQLQLLPQSKKAVITHYVGRPRGKQLFNYLEWVSKLHERNGEFIGQEIMDGQTCNVFLIQKGVEKTTIWVSPETNLPVRVERILAQGNDNDFIIPYMYFSERDFGGEGTGFGVMTMSTHEGLSGRGGIKEKMTTVMSDFVWDVNLDESLFSLMPPVGYTVENRVQDASIPEKDLIEVFAFWTEMSGGLFPSEISDIADFDKTKPMIIEKFNKNGNSKEELNQAEQITNKIIKALIFVQERNYNKSWYYAGKGAQLGDANVAICWWKYRDSVDYRVIHGDLSIGDSPIIPALHDGR